MAKHTKAEVEEKTVEIFNLICPGWLGARMVFDGKIRVNLKDILKPIKEAVSRAK